jgi:Raf kinase inhibitor-like YbhB/YbcL family protein
MLAAMKRLAIGLVVIGIVGCGGGTAKPAPAECTPDPTGAMTLTSSAFTSCEEIPLDHTCTTHVNTSPPLAWTGAPSGTQSFAVVMKDLTASPPLVHWVIYDIPATATSLPAAVQTGYAPANVAGAHQTESYLTDVRGYLGPCPSTPDTYQFSVHAIKLATLPAGEDTTRDEAISWIADNESASATLTGTYTP